MKTAISVPDDLFSRVDRLARRRNLSRSAIFSTAAAEYVSRHEREDITARLNAVYAEQSSEVDSALDAMQRRVLSTESW